MNPDAEGRDLVKDRHDDLFGTATAIFNTDRTHRYLLRRRWAAGGDLAVFIMLNPSTADAFTDDPTIRRCVSFAKREDKAGLVVLNLFALRSTDPAALRTHPDPIGVHNDQFIERYTRGAALVVAAWGVHGALRNRSHDVTEVLDRSVKLRCLGTTKAGHPRHPLYVAGSAALLSFPAPNHGEHA